MELAPADLDHLKAHVPFRNYKRGQLSPYTLAALKRLEVEGLMKVTQNRARGESFVYTTDAGKNAIQLHRYADVLF